MLCLDRAFHDVNGAVDVISRSADSGLVETPVRSPVFSLRQAHPSPLLSGRPAMGRKLCRKGIAIDLKWVSRDYKDFMQFPNSPTKCLKGVRSPSLRMNRLLHVRVDGYHTVVEVWVLAHKNLWVPGHRNKDSIDSTAQWRGEDVA